MVYAVVENNNFCIFVEDNNVIEKKPVSNVSPCNTL